ncbi:hypothetical protein F5Y16DRAFT_18533 [Xylariaceae sp. FL0255]|nr:hypothetical protein F5Y16DRAFT_18533 [Xylariaceae sp. FL0255]
MKPSYRDYVRVQAGRNPCLSGLVSFLSTGAYHPQLEKVNIYCLEHPARPDTTATVRRVSFDDCAVEVQRGRASGKCVRLTIFIEDVTPDLIEKFGALLDIDPMFFANYISTSFEGMEEPLPPAMALFPTRMASSQMLHIHYQKVVDLQHQSQDDSPAYHVFQNSNTVPRSARRLLPMSGTEPGLIRGCCSILLRTLSPLSWVCLVLVDSTSLDAKMSKAPSEERSMHSDRIWPGPLKGGFEDFEKPISFTAFCSSVDEKQFGSEWKNQSLLRVLLRYSLKPPPDFDPCQPSIISLGYYALRTIAAEWMLYVRLLNSYLKHYEYSFHHTARQPIEADLDDLQRWRRRCKQSSHKLRLVELFLDQQLSNLQLAKSGRKVNQYAVLRDDFRYLASEVDLSCRYLELILPMAGTIVQLVDTRRSIKEAINVRYLTYVGLIFVPLTFVSGLFSMSDGFIPGQGNFWIYAAVAAPLLLIVLGSAITFSLVGKRKYDAKDHCYC